MITVYRMLSGMYLNSDLALVYATLHNSVTLTMDFGGISGGSLLS